VSSIQRKQKQILLLLNMNPLYVTWADALIFLRKRRRGSSKAGAAGDVFSRFAMSCVYTLLSSRNPGKACAQVLLTYFASPACLAAEAGVFFSSPAVPQLYDVRKGGYRRGMLLVAHSCLLICQRFAVGRVGWFYFPFFCRFVFQGPMLGTGSPMQAGRRRDGILRSRVFYKWCLIFLVANVPVSRPTGRLMEQDDLPART